MTIADRVAADLKAREALGLKKYGVELGEADYTKIQILQHLYEELLDGANYIKTLIEKEQGLVPPKPVSCANPHGCEYPQCLTNGLGCADD